MVRCPNLGPLAGCDILGTQLWFSAPSGDHCLPTLELVEVNGGFLVGINPEILKQLATEAIREGFIKELRDYRITEQDSHGYDQDAITVLMLEKDFMHQCYVCLEHVICVNDEKSSFVPVINKLVDPNLEYLILRKKQGYRAVLLYCVLHSGADNLKFDGNIDPEYGKKIAYAIDNGVEVIAYRANISTQEMLLNHPITIDSPIIIAKS
jgi:sugar fermentation stimulation protein A